MATSLTTRRILVRSFRCCYWSGPREFVDRIPLSNLPSPPPTMRIFLSQDRPFSTMERWNPMIRSPRCFTTTSDQDPGDVDEEETYDEDDASTKDHPKVHLYAVYGYNDLEEIRERGFVEAQALLDETKDETDETQDEPPEEEGDAPSFTFAEEADVFSLHDIFSKAKDLFGTWRDLQYYHIEENIWHNLHDHEDLDIFRTYCFASIFPSTTSQPSSPKVVPIRIPQYYQEKEEETDEEDYMADSPNTHNLEGMIEYLLFQLMKSEWQRVEVPESDVTSATVWRLRRAMLPEECSAAAVAPEASTPAVEEPASAKAEHEATTEGQPEEEAAATNAAAPSTESPPEEEGFVYLNTRDWVLQQAASNAKLRSLLVYYPHSLEHITECLHYSFLWDNFPRRNDGTPHPEGISAIEDELPSTVERVVSPSANSSGEEEAPEGASTSSSRSST
jgi:hypothetical protein